MKIGNLFLCAAALACELPAAAAQVQRQVGPLSPLVGGMPALAISGAPTLPAPQDALLSAPIMTALEPAVFLTPQAAAAPAVKTLELMQGAAPEGSGAARSDAAGRQATAFDNSVPRGLVRHGEHFADLILSQGGSSDPRYLNAYGELTRSLLNHAKAGKFPRVNEKIDGSPSIVLGLNAENRPFVSYKGDLTKVEKTQRLVTSEADARKFFKILSPLYSTAIKYFGARMEGLAKTEFKDYIFQGDLLFYESAARGGQGRKIKSGDAITISANSITYEVKKDHPYFAPLSSAKIGVVIHTIGRRVIQGGRLTVEPLEGVDKADAIEAFASRLNSPEVFAVSPWKNDVAVGTRTPLDKKTERQVVSLLEGMEKKLSGLSPEFKDDWAKRHESRFRIFFNSYLRPPHHGGIYLAASRQEPFAAEKLLADFGAWLRSRVQPRDRRDRKTGLVTAQSLETPGYLKAVARTLAEHKQELYRMLEAYYGAIRIQYLIQPHIEEIFRSKLGGGESEGAMLETSDTIVKLVDRLGFTLKNNAKWNRGAAPSVPYTAPYDHWRPGAAFVLMKGQPAHSGHIEMIKRAVEANGGRPVFVTVSHKTADLQASDWKGLKVSPTKKELAAGDYRYVFSEDLRREILESGLGEGSHVYFLDTEEFWGYLRRARQDKAQGKVRLVVGQKEMAQHRYDHQFQEFKEQLEPLIVKMQEGGISATQVRAALKDYIRGTAARKKAAKKTLDAALVSIPEEAERGKLLARMVAEWKTVDAVVHRVLGQNK